jgi:hypothetical protein
VAAVEGDAPLACLLRVDRQVFELRRAAHTLATRLLTLEEQLGGR